MKKPLFTPNQIKNIIKLYKNGKSFNYIAFKYSRDSKTIKRLLENNGISCRSKKEQMNLRTVHFTHIQEQKILKLYKNNNSILKIAKIFNRDPKIINRTLKKYNIKIKTNGEQHLKFTNIFAFRKIDSHEKAYWLGFLAADGNVGRSGQLRLQLAEKDRPHLMKFYNFMRGRGKVSIVISTVNGKKFKGIQVNFKSNELLKDLYKHNLIPNKGATLKLSEHIPKKYLNSYIRGLIDGDGSFNINKKMNRMGFTLCSSICTCKQVQQILIKECKVNLVKIYPSKNKKYCYLAYTGNQNAGKIAAFLYEKGKCPIFLERKKKIVFDHLLNKSEIFRKAVK